MAKIVERVADIQLTLSYEGHCFIMEAWDFSFVFVATSCAVCYRGPIISLDQGGELRYYRWCIMSLTTTP